MNILYFAWVREQIGRDQEQIDPPSTVEDINGLIAWLAGRGGGYAAALADPTRLRAAVDQRFVPLDAPIDGATEIALFPPVTGG